MEPAQDNNYHLHKINKNKHTYNIFSKATKNHSMEWFQGYTDIQYKKS